MKKIIIGLIVLIIGISIVLRASTESSETENKLETVKIESVSAGDYRESYTTVGRLTSKDDIKVISYASGQISEVYVKKGDVVKKDQILFTIKESDDLITEKNQVSSVSAQLNSARKVMADAKANYEKTNQLFQSGIASQSELNQAKLAYEQSQSQVQQLSNSLSSTNEAIQRKEDSLEVKSPVAGTLIAFDIKPHENYAQDEVIIQQSVKKVLNLGIPEKHIDMLNKNSTVDIYVKSMDRHFKGQITHLGSNAIESTGLYPVEVLVEGDDLKQGMYCEIDFTLDLRNKLIMIPNNSVILDKNQPFVYIHENGEVIKKTVTLGPKSGKMVVIEDGLTLDEQLIIQGQGKVVPGQKVDVAN